MFSSGRSVDAVLLEAIVQDGVGKGIVAHVAQLVEHVLGKDEVIGSNPIVGSSIK